MPQNQVRGQYGRSPRGEEESATMLGLEPAFGQSGDRLCATPNGSQVLQAADFPVVDHELAACYAPGDVALTVTQAIEAGSSLAEVIVRGLAGACSGGRFNRMIYTTVVCWNSTEDANPSATVERLVPWSRYCASC